MKDYPDPKGDVSRLPKWAQEHIRQLKGDLNRTRAELAKRDEFIAEQHPGTNVYLDTGLNDPRPLPRNAHVSFRLADDGRWDNAITVRHSTERPGRIYITSLQGVMSIYPRAGNAIEISAER